jgi:hypothetical protein
MRGVSMFVEDYVKIIEEEFSYLFDRYGFKVVYSEQKNNNKYRAGIESKICKILFVREQGAGVIYLGPPTAPFLNEFGNSWIEIANLIMYLTQEKIDWNKVDKYKGENRIRPIMKLLANIFEPHCPKALEMFSSNEMIARWRPMYKQYIRQVYSG